LDDKNNVMMKNASIFHLTTARNLFYWPKHYYKLWIMYWCIVWCPSVCQQFNICLHIKKTVVSTLYCIHMLIYW